MLIKRLFSPPAGWVAVRNARLPSGVLPDPAKPENELLNPPPLQAVELRHTGIKARQNFSDRMVAALFAAGLMRFDGEGAQSALLFDVVVNGKPEVLRYKVLRAPGSYCLHCGENLNDNTVNDGAPSRAHVALKHAGPAPIPGNPAGYERIHCYECELDPDQHAKYSVEQWDAARKGAA